MAARYLIGIDIGTSGTKTVLFDQDLNLVAEATFSYPLWQPQALWAEQDPEDWFDAAVKGIRQVTAGIDRSQVAGIGLSGQMHGLVMLDSDGRVLRRSIIWCDQRCEEECAEITDLVGRQRLIDITANPALTGFTAGKIRWVQKHEPELWEKTAHILLPKDYVRFRLTGDFATEVSDASGMQLMHIAERRFSGEICDLLGVRTELLPRMYESQDVTGQLSAEAAERTGLPRSVVLVGGAGDQAASAVGNGIVHQGLISDNIGTSGVVFAATDRPLIDPAGRVHTFCHAVPGMWHIMGVTQGAGLSLQWFRNQFYAAEYREAAAVGENGYDRILRDAEQIAPGCDGVLFLPYLMGERTPHLDAAAKGVFFGLTNATTRAHMLRAVLEGVAYSQLDCLSIIRQMGVEADSVRISGGGARNPFWRGIFSDIFETPLACATSTESGALGVALLAGVGAGLFPSVGETCDRLIHTAQRIEPQPREIYRKQYRTYGALYSSLKQLFRA